MAIACVTLGRECDGCMSCEDRPEVIGHCVACHGEIYTFEPHYEILGDLIHEDCLSEWASRYKVVDL